MGNLPKFAASGIAAILIALPAVAGVGDPQLKTDHPWYPGELACSTFDRLFATQAEQFERLVGRVPESDEDRALAAWMWRNTHYWHGEEGKTDLWGEGLDAGPDRANREYWTGLFANGFGLCGTTHAQWSAEIQKLLGHNRGRVAGVQGHNAFEVFLTGGPYGDGQWVLLDHDVSTVVFDPEGKRLLSIPEIQADLSRLTDPVFQSDRQRGWPVCGLHPDDGSAYRHFHTVEYLAGYAAAPPMVHLRRGETLRRYLEPGLEEGKTFVFWGRNYNNGEIPGPERPRTWVNQPERFLGTPEGSGYNPGQARYANAVFTYKPDFRSGDYREGIIEETDDRIVFEFESPYVIAATPPDDSDWGIYKPGGRNGLVVEASADCSVSISTDGGRTWQDGGQLPGPIDLTDRVKGRYQYLIRLGARAGTLKDSDLKMTTVCQANSSVLPRLTDVESLVTFEASGRAVISAGPGKAMAQTHVIDGGFDTPRVALEVATPRGEPIVSVHASAHVRSSNPPDPEIKYHIDLSSDGGTTWKPLVSDWQIERRGEEPGDFWSQSFCWGEADLFGIESDVSRVQVGFRNDGGKQYARAEVRLVYKVDSSDPTRVTFAWSDDSGEQTASNVFPSGSETSTWTVPTGHDVRTRWVEFEPVAESR
ncbi:hypothetical protein BH23PLA1_BH23PLA1_37880 [soil metagenome]